VTPEFYVAVKDFYQASEVIGQHELGTSIATGDQDRIATKIETSEKLTARINALSKIVVGLSYYSLRRFDKSLELFKSAQAVPNWDDGEGKQVLHLLVGNAALKLGKVDEAKQAFTTSLKLDPEYARAYVSLAAAESARAMVEANDTQDFSRIDVHLLDSAIGIYRKALAAKHKPAQSDVQAKVDFGIGQAFLRRALQDQDENSYNQAADLFHAVFMAYGDGANSRLQELAAQSHAHLALILSHRNDNDSAAAEFEQAAALLSDLDSQAFAETIATFSEMAMKVKVKNR
jgi:tetratricopeptide (TPR) repeat protein